MDAINLDLADGFGPRSAGVRIKPPKLPRSTWFRRAVRAGFSALGTGTKILFQCLLLAGLTYGCYDFIHSHLFSSVQVSGVSMMPTLQNTQRLLLDRWTYLIRDPQPNDIVVIKDPEDNLLSIKRIVGGNGDSIRLKGGRVYVNGRLLDEPYLAPGTPTYGLSNRSGDEWIICGKGRYFLLGDNRNNSADSRVYGAVRRENILGTVIH